MASPIPSGDCTVTINGNQFNIVTGTTRPTNVDYSVLYANFRAKISSAGQSILHANNINSFETLNAAINYGDSIKDGTSVGEMTSLNVFDFVAPGTTPPTGAKGFSLAQLKTFAHFVKDLLIQQGEITRVAFARDKKGDVSAKSRWESVDALCAFDSGLGLDAWLTRHKTFTSFGKYIDPSTSRSSDYVFPIKDKTLSISTDVFTQFGYGPYCNLTSAICHALVDEKYTYDMQVNSYLNQSPVVVPILKSDNKKRDEDPNKNLVFPGNKVKKSFTGDQKFVAVVMKGLGDKLQVFLAFILKSVIGASNRSVVCVATCDEIVLIFCTLMNVPCWFTSIGVENGLKVNEVLYYNQDNNSPDSVKKRIVSEYKVVKEGYDELITLIEFMERSSNYQIQVSGDTKMHVLPSAFYSQISADLKIIRGNVHKLYDGYSSLTDITELNGILTCIKSAAVNNFVRQARDHSNIVLIRTANKYNSSTDPRINAGISKTNKLTFLDYANSFGSVRGGGLQHFNGGAKKTPIDMERFFNNDELIAFVKPDELLDPPPAGEPNYVNEVSFDAALNLRAEIFKICDERIVAKPKTKQWIRWDVLSDVLHQLNFNDCRTATLEKLVHKFRRNVIKSNAARRTSLKPRRRTRVYNDDAISPEHSSAKQNPTLTDPMSRSRSRSSATSHSSPVPSIGNFDWVVPGKSRASQKLTRQNSAPTVNTRRLRTPGLAARRRAVLQTRYSRSPGRSIDRGAQRRKTAVKLSDKNRTATRAKQFNSARHLSGGGRRVTQKNINKRLWSTK